MRRTLHALLGAISLSVVAACLWTSAADLVHRLRHPAAPEYLSGWREMARTIESGKVAVWCGDAHEPSPLDRARLIAANWELRPRAALPCDRKDDLIGIDHVLISASRNETARQVLSDAAFHPVSSNSFTVVWSREENPTKGSRTRGDPLETDVRSIVGVGTAVLLLIVVVLSLHPHRTRVSGWRIVEALLVFAALASVTVSHTLQPPNGLGVQAGKAALWSACGGLPSGFWTSPEFAVYQPSYPPGLTLLALVSMFVSGTVEDCLIQLIVPAATALLYLILASAGRSWQSRLMALAFVLSPIALRMTTGFYAEPLAALVLALGWMNVRAKRLRVGWLLIGSCALFRHEGLLLAAFSFAVLRVCAGSAHAPISHAVCALAPGLAWQVVTRLTGAQIYDYDFGGCPSVSLIGTSLGSWFRFATWQFTVAGGAVVSGLIALSTGLRSGRPVNRFLLASVLLVGVSGLAFSVLFGFNVSQNANWIVATCTPRLLWLASIPLFPAGNSIISVMKNDCIFCAIAAGEIPSFKIYEDELVLAYLDINPFSEGHTLVIPKAHSTGLVDTPDETLAAVIARVKKVAAHLKAALPCDGFNILQNNGAAAGQTVMHLHFHIVPRYGNEPIVFESRSGDMDHLKALAERIRFG